MLVNKKNEQKNVADEFAEVIESMDKYRITSFEMVFLYNKVSIPFHEHKTPSLWLIFDYEKRLAGVFQDTDLSMQRIDRSKLIELPSSIVHSVVSDLVHNRHNGLGTELSFAVEKDVAVQPETKMTKAWDLLQTKF